LNSEWGSNVTWGKLGAVTTYYLTGKERERVNTRVTADRTFNKKDDLGGE